MLISNIQRMLERTDQAPLLITILSMAAFYFAVKKITRIMTDDNRYPILAPGGICCTIKNISGSNSPWFMLQTAKDLKSNIYRLSLPSPQMTIVVGDHKVARKILKDPLSKKPKSIYKSFEVLLAAPNMFSSNGDFWHRRRKDFALSFSKNHVNRMNKMAVEKTEDWIKKKLYPTIEQGKSFDVAEEMINITLDSICATAFEYHMDDKEKGVFWSELEIAAREFVENAANPFRSLFGFMISGRRRAFIARKKLQLISKNIMESYRNLKEPTKDTVIDRIMKSDVLENDEQRAAEIMTFLIAGHDTTGYSIAFTLLELARNPTELQKLRESLSSLPPEEWAKSNHLRTVIKESMRLYPVAAFGPSRVIGKDMLVQDESNQKILLPKGSVIFLPILLHMRNEKVFEKAESFIPSRWIDPSKDALEAFLPFALGRQNCIGQSLANAELHSIVARICSEFDLKIEEEGVLDHFLTLKPSGARLLASKIV